MAGIHHVAVIDIGKTNAKVALVDLDCPFRRWRFAQTTNTVRQDDSIPSRCRGAAVVVHPPAVWRVSISTPRRRHFDHDPWRDGRTA